MSQVANIKRMNGLATDLQMFALKTLQIPLLGKHPHLSVCLMGLLLKGMIYFISTNNYFYLQSSLLSSHCQPLVCKELLIKINKRKMDFFFFFFGDLGFALACLVSTSIQCHDGLVFLSLYYAFINLLALEFMTLHSCSIHVSNTLLSYCIYMFKTLQKKKKKLSSLCLLMHRQHYRVPYYNRFFHCWRQ